MVGRVALVAAVAACSGNKRPAREDAMRAPARDSAPAPMSPDSRAAPPVLGEAAIKVEWKAAPTSARQSPGTTPCNTRRPGAVAPTTLWAIPEVLVLTDKVPPATADARIVLASCALSPRIVLGTSLVVESALDRPGKVTLVEHGTIDKLDALSPGKARTFQLPIAGHAVSIPLAANGVYQLAIEGVADTEPAWVVAAPGAVTDAGGLASLALPLGTHAVTAWLPPRGGQQGKVARSTITVEKDQLAELVVDLGTP